MLVWRIQSWVKCLCLAYRSLFRCPNLWLYILSICWCLSKFSISTPDLSSKLHICVCKCFFYQADWLINRQNGTLGSFLSCSLNISFLRFAISVNNITAAQLLRPKILRLIFDLARSKVAVPALSAVLPECIPNPFCSVCAVTALSKLHDLVTRFLL